MAATPKSLTIRTYNVGFGDCFLLSFLYAADSEKHVLVDFGSTGMPQDIGESPDARMTRIARDIEKRSGGKLTAVVATHRHKDHISGFATNSDGKGSGDIIRGLKPSLVVQPWTEDPKLAPDATGPAAPITAAGKKHVAGLASMNETAAHIAAVSRKNNRQLADAVRDQLSFLGEDNIQNLSAVKNLMSMAENRYVYAGSPSGLEKLLPGVNVNVLGPPTLKQTATIKNEVASDPNEFWQFQANALAQVAPQGNRGPAALFPKHVLTKGPTFPVNARWFVWHSRAVRGDQLLQIVRILDDAMNNTSVILLFQIGKETLLFPGDAQIENWSYALSIKANLALLGSTNLYKVGHHGSRNATPRSLWKLFKHRSPAASPTRLISLMSTMEGKHGSAANKSEVPRKTLVDALKKDTDLFTTQALVQGQFFHDTTVTF